MAFYSNATGHDRDCTATVHCVALWMLGGGLETGSGKKGTWGAGRLMNEELRQWLAAFEAR